MHGFHHGERRSKRFGAMAAAFGRGHKFGPDGPFGRDGPFGPGGPFGGGGRRGKRFAGEALRLMVLGLLSEQPQHGYQLIRSFAEKSGEGYIPSPGVLYPILSLLEDQELVEAVLGEQKTRRVFDLTEAGRDEVKAKEAEIAELFARLSAMADQANRTDAAPITRAMMNLRTAAVQRMTREGADSETAFSIAAILDEAAQKIERL
jgi:DNA-binding PadR family transcriptional regulator